MALGIEPDVVDEIRAIDDERVAVPAPDRVAIPERIGFLGCERSR
jgi:hypothetical protein